MNTEAPMEDLQEKGRAILKAVTGEAYFEARSRSTNDFNRPLRDLVETYCFGAVWGSEVLPRRTRSMLVIAMLAALGRSTELRTHVIGAVNNGCSIDEIRDVLLQVAIYCGVPAGVESTRVAEATLQDLGLLSPNGAEQGARRP